MKYILAHLASKSYFFPKECRLMVRSNVVRSPQINGSWRLEVSDVRGAREHQGYETSKT